uniref:Uncharacterized protein n=1 Tax=Oryza barthii TaxID=65489 RepID=A0A0D3GZS7_9ORYZ
MSGSFITRVLFPTVKIKGEGRGRVLQRFNTLALPGKICCFLFCNFTFCFS